MNQKFDPLVGLRADKKVEDIITGRMLRHHRRFHPRIAIVLGSGLGALAGDVQDALVIAYKDLPGFPIPTASSHFGELIIGELNGVDVMVLAGRAHYYEHGNPREMAFAIEMLKATGIDTLILSNAAGSLHDSLPPGSAMLITDHINWSGLNPLIGTEGDRRFVDMVGAYDAGLCAAFRKAAGDIGMTLAEGVYMWFSGPSFETPAEIRMARMLGADAVGMSTVPEVLLARYHGLKVAGLSLITNYGAGMTGKALSHDETKSEAGKASEQFRRLMAKAVAHMKV